MTKDSVFGEHFLVNNELSSVKIVATDRGEYAKVHLQEDIKSSNSILSKRILEAAARFPSDSEIFEHYRLYLYEQHRKTEAMAQVYAQDRLRRQTAKEALRRYK